MGFCLKPNIVYNFNPTNLSLVTFQPVNGDVLLYGSNITRYSYINGNRKIIIPKFEELIPIYDDYLQKDCFHPMTSIVTWLGFKSDNPDAELWCSQGLNITVTPSADQEFK